MNTTRLIELKYIQGNPWQAREKEDPEHIRSLAESIAAQGLMQVAMGRWIDSAGDLATGLELGATEDILIAGFRVQLAFGHSRLAAFKYLTAAGVEGFELFPVLIRDLDDEELFDRLIDENKRRKGLNPIEEANQMETYRFRFGKTSVEIGKRFGYSDSAVRNILRLLKLPESIQNMLRTSEMSQGNGRALVALYDIPEAVRLEAEDSDDLKPSEIIELARSGISPDKVSELVARLARRINPQVTQLPIEESSRLSAVSGQPEEEPAPAPRPAPLPVPSAAAIEETEDNEDNGEELEDDTVSTETVDEPEEVRNYDPAEEMEEEPEEPVHATEPEPPAPKPQPAAQPLKAEPKPAPKPQPVQTPAPRPAAPVAAPAPAPEPVAAIPWEKSTILLSLTLWPEDSLTPTQGRMVSIGGRTNQGAVIMALARFNDLALAGPLQEMLSKLHQNALDAIPAEVEG